MSNLRLSFILTCLMLAQQVCLGAGCDPKTYLHKGQCCNLCPPGHFVKEDCSEKKQTTCASCLRGTYSQETDARDECKPCTTCKQVVLRQCSTTLDANCACRKGFNCTSPKCSECVEKICPRGRMLIRTGVIEYTYLCEPCPDDMYSDKDGGVCKPLTQCDQSGQETIFPGNKTHNSACSMPTPESGKASVNMEVILVAILLLCVFTSLAVLVKTCMSKARCRMQKKLIKSMKACPSMTVDLSDEILGCQLSKEERGDCPIQENDTKASLTSLTPQTCSRNLPGKNKY
ncbi:hypothetical protein SKAU_G00172760 [Synaphobranchus kaupii]|uniref:TNFR-Cys domain-containing protein n=1 Tax=Synaphobranchus kaupii TaxID=118154 RepID=A0A9Q1IZZ3_SYNKA|nr:hypothetical protein SKAU_G00172760 [Synaphobranchus kaupii]